jgi:hypothetical protein
MARNALMGLLKSLVADHSEAEQRDLPIEVIREERAQAKAGLGRRQFLIGAAAGAAALAIPRRASATPRTADRDRRCGYLGDLGRAHLAGRRLRLDRLRVLGADRRPHVLEQRGLLE